MHGFLNGLDRLTFYRGRVALYAILQGLGVENSDEVVTQAFTCVAVPEAITASGARPVYADIEPNYFNMDAGDLERKITPQTRAIVVQHTYGIPADMERIKYVADKADIPIIEDCCHTFVSTYKGKIVGSFGVGGFYSYEWGKPIVVGVGGSAVVNDAGLKQIIEGQYSDYRLPAATNRFRLQLQYLAHSILYRPFLFWPVRSLYHFLGSLGAAESNYNPIKEDGAAKDFSLKMSEPLRRRLSRKLKELDAITRHSRNVAAEYRSRINSSVVSHPVLPEDSETAFARYPLISQDKVALLAKARKANVELADWYSTPVHPLEKDDWGKVYYEARSCPNVEARCEQVVTLPTHSAVRRRDIDRAIKFLNEVNLSRPGAKEGRNAQ